MSKYLLFLFFFFSYLLLDFFGSNFSFFFALCRTFFSSFWGLCLVLFFFFFSFNLLLVFGVEILFLSVLSFVLGPCVDIFLSSSFFLLLRCRIFFSCPWSWVLFLSVVSFVLGPCVDIFFFFSCSWGAAFFLSLELIFFSFKCSFCVFSLSFSPWTLVIRNWFPCFLAASSIV